MITVKGEDMAMSSALARPVVPLGDIKTLGPVGPKYQVGEWRRHLDDGDSMIEITLIESGEKAEYRLSHILGDPKAA